jgi:hypothetical protein
MRTPLVRGTSEVVWTSRGMGTSFRVWAGLSAVHAARVRRVAQILEESMWIKITEVFV